MILQQEIPLLKAHADRTLPASLEPSGTLGVALYIAEDDETNEDDGNPRTEEEKHGGKQCHCRFAVQQAGTSP